MVLYLYILCFKLFQAEDEDDLWGAKRRIRDRELTKDNAPENKPKVIKTWKQESVARKKRDKLHKEGLLFLFIYISNFYFSV